MPTILSENLRIQVTANKDWERSKWADELGHLLAHLAGGTTETPCTIGRYIFKDGSSVKEPSYSIEVLTNDAWDVLNGILPTLRAYLVACEQESLLVVINGTGYIYDTTEIIAAEKLGA